MIPIANRPVGPLLGTSEYKGEIRCREKRYNEVDSCREQGYKGVDHCREKGHRKVVQ